MWEIEKRSFDFDPTNHDHVHLATLAQPQHPAHNELFNFLLESIRSSTRQSPISTAEPAERQTTFEKMKR